MSHVADMPVWLACVIAFFVVLGSTLVLLGTLGLLRLASFYDRLHAPTLGTSWGTAGIIIASMLMFSWVQGRVVLHELIIGVFIMVTTPVTLMLLGRAALSRDRIEDSPELPDAIRLAKRKHPAEVMEFHGAGAPPEDREMDTDSGDAESSLSKPQ